MRIAFWVALLGVPAVLKVADILSSRGVAPARGVRLVTVNVGTKPKAVAEALRVLRPDIVFMQETAGSCAGAARALDLNVSDGEDQCVLSRWPLSALPIEWPGPWQPPQIVGVEHPTYGRLILVNVRLALPYVLGALTGNDWYSETERRNQYAALRQLIVGKQRAVVCGDFNAFPFEVQLGTPFADMWSGFRYGATFPGWLPTARIDQCWATPELIATARWTRTVPSDHRAVVIDFQGVGAR